MSNLEYLKRKQKIFFFKAWWCDWFVVWTWSVLFGSPLCFTNQVIDNISLIFSFIGFTFQLYCLIVCFSLLSWTLSYFCFYFFGYLFLCGWKKLCFAFIFVGLSQVNNLTAPIFLVIYFSLLLLFSTLSFFIWPNNACIKNKSLFHGWRYAMTWEMIISEVKFFILS